MSFLPLSLLCGTSRVILGTALWLTSSILAGCGDDDSGSPDAGVVGDAGDSGVTATAGGRWPAAFEAKGVAASCDPSAAELAAMPQVQVGDSVLYVGYVQANANNQHPVLLRYDGGRKVYCVRHETQAPDGRALGLSWDGGEYAYVVYSVDGGGTDLEGKEGWLSSYAPGAISGGGPKVSVIGRVRAQDGALQTATFVIAVTSNNKVNTHAAKEAPVVADDGTVDFLGDSRFVPIDADGRSRMQCGNNAPFQSRYRFSGDLRTLVCADSSDCTSTMPCP
ncbi:MAG: hypothetical protein ACPGUV_08445 [Polyangiales bacterium]